MQDKTRKGRGRNPSGEKNSNAVLSDADVQEIRDRCAEGETQTALAKEYGVHQTTISVIVRKVHRPLSR
jgi:hypothetical protein